MYTQTQHTPEIGKENHLLSTRIIFKVQRNKNILDVDNFGKVTELIKMRKNRSLMGGFLSNGKMVCNSVGQPYNFFLRY